MWRRLYHHTALSVVLTNFVAGSDHIDLEFATWSDQLPVSAEFAATSEVTAYFTDPSFTPAAADQNEAPVVASLDHRPPRNRPPPRVPRPHRRRPRPKPLVTEIDALPSPYPGKGQCPTGLFPFGYHCESGSGVGPRYYLTCAEVDNHGFPIYYDYMRSEVTSTRISFPCPKGYLCHVNERASRRFAPGNGKIDCKPGKILARKIANGLVIVRPMPSEPQTELESTPPAGTTCDDDDNNDGKGIMYRRARRKRPRLVNQAAAADSPDAALETLAIELSIDLHIEQPPAEEAEPAVAGSTEASTSTPVPLEPLQQLELAVSQCGDFEDSDSCPFLRDYPEPSEDGDSSSRTAFCWTAATSWLIP